MPAARARSARTKGRVSYAEDATSASEDDGGSAKNKGGRANGSSKATGPGRRANGRKQKQSDDDEDKEEDEDDQPQKKRGRKSGQRASATAKKRKVESESSADSEEEYEDDDDEDEDDSEGEADSNEYVSASSTPKKAPKSSTKARYQPEVASVTKLVPAPKQAHRQGKLGKPVIEFLDHLQIPEHNDRDWFNAHHNVWKWVKQDFDDFVSTLTDQLIDRVDETVPFLPPKDVVYRIHRDIRFSNDKTPYKRTLMATFSRGGRKGPYAGYHLCVRARGGTGLHAGIWDPPAPMLQSLREHIRDGTPQIQHFKEIISRPEFVEAFGKPHPAPPSRNQKQGSLWGRDELKNGPKGFDKTHPDMDLLRLKSFCISHSFSDEETYNNGKDLAAGDPKDFMEKLVRVARIAKDFVECLNDILHPEPL